MNVPTDNDDDANDDIARLLRATGARPEPPPAMRARVHAAVLQTFDALPVAPRPEQGEQPPRWYARIARLRAAPGRRLPTAAWRHAIAATLLATVVTGLYLNLRPDADAVAAYANFSRGAAHINDALFTGSAPIPEHASIRTGADAALELLLIDGARIRVQGESRFVLHDDNRIELQSGRLYFDVQGNSGRVQVQTPQGAIRDIGTQFEVRVDASAVTIVVREGQVQMDGDRLHLTASARGGLGESVHVDAAGRIERRAISSTDPHWQWLADARPDYLLERGSLHDFLRWSASEGGLTLRYQNEAVRQAAVATRPHGSISGMSPQAAIDAVLATSRLRRQAAAAHELLIDFASEE